MTPRLSPIVRFARDVLHFELYPAQARILADIYQENIRVAVLRLGRRSGKGRMAAVIAAYEATVNAEAHLAAVPQGERVVVAIVATSREQARIVHRYIGEFFRGSELAPLVSADTGDELRLHNGITILTLPCTSRSTRGLSVAVLIMDEAAWMLDTDGSPMAGDELWSATYPATALFPQGKAIITSTPRWSTGWFADMCRTAASGEDPTWRAWHASTEEMNPAIPPGFLASERAKDPAAFAREYEASFESGVGACFEAESVRAAVAARGMLLAVFGTKYAISIDAAYVGDAFAAVTGHLDGERLVVDRVDGWQGARGRPLRHDDVLDSVAGIARSYGGAEVVLDQYAAEPIAQGLAARGVLARRSPWTNESKAEAVATLRGFLYQGRLELPRHPDLVAQLVSLEQRPLPSGRLRIAAPPGQHDDYATALMALAGHLHLGVGSWGGGRAWGVTTAR